MAGVVFGKCSMCGKEDSSFYVGGVSLCTTCWTGFSTGAVPVITSTSNIPSGNYIVPAPQPLTITAPSWPTIWPGNTFTLPISNVPFVPPVQPVSLIIEPGKNAIIVRDQEGRYIVRFEAEPSSKFLVEANEAIVQFKRFMEQKVSGDRKEILKVTLGEITKLEGDLADHEHIVELGRVMLGVLRTLALQYSERVEAAE